MATKLDTGDLLNILSGILDDEDLDRIKNWTELEDQILLGAALQQLGETITKDARKEALKMYGGASGPQNLGRVVVNYTAPHSQNVINTQMVKDFYPIGEFPRLYKKREIRETVRFTITKPARKPRATHKKASF